MVNHSAIALAALGLALGVACNSDEGSVVPPTSPGKADGFSAPYVQRIVIVDDPESDHPYTDLGADIRGSTLKLTYSLVGGCFVDQLQWDGTASVDGPTERPVVDLHLALDIEPICENDDYPIDWASFYDLDLLRAVMTDEGVRIRFVQGDEVMGEIDWSGVADIRNGSRDEDDFFATDPEIADVTLDGEILSLVESYHDHPTEVHRLLWSGTMKSVDGLVDVGLIPETTYDRSRYGDPNASDRFRYDLRQLRNTVLTRYGDSDITLQLPGQPALNLSVTGEPDGPALLADVDPSAVSEPFEIDSLEKDGDILRISGTTSACGFHGFELQWDGEVYSTGWPDDEESIALVLIHEAVEATPCSAGDETRILEFDIGRVTYDRPFYNDDELTIRIGNVELDAWF